MNEELKEYVRSAVSNHDNFEVMNELVVNLANEAGK